ncbi:alanine/glycine:cation symporter family protein [Filifactor villosus]|uniref:Alanine/glycine:cation symporter family protein n=1 Tax=Filifactor villosus TaxID=29374 RepID=A0ABV9QLL6_9FIRM
MNISELITVIVYDYLWGLPLVVLILGVGAYLTFRTGFFQFSFFGRSIQLAKKSVMGDKADSPGDKAGILSSFEAMSMALGTTIGVGNIGGVAAAIALGGPGAVFWMWIAGLFGLVVKTVEITLAVYYRSKNSRGESYGGPNYYIHKGIGIEKNKKMLAKLLGILFAFGYVLAIFINIQTYTVSEAVAGTFNFNINVVAVVYTIALYIMISGGMKQLGKIATIIVPFMCIFYIVGGLIVVLLNIQNLIPSFGLIIASAFTKTAAVGGFAGAGVKLALTSGLSRSVFSNEAGWGSAPMIHASAKINHPLKQGLLGIFEVFFDTVVVCSLTALVIIITGQWSSGLDGATLTLSAFESGMGSFGRIILTVGIFFFGLTTSSGVYTQIEVVLRYILGDTALKERLLTGYKWFYPIPSAALVFIASKHGLPGTTVWLISDAATAFPIFANMIALFMLTPVFLKLVEDYKARYMKKGSVDPDFNVFYEGSNEENKVDRAS